jgi:hypothetical protein
MVSFTPRSLYPHGNSHRYHMDRRLSFRASLDAVERKIICF